MWVFSLQNYLCLGIWNVLFCTFFHSVSGSLMLFILFQFGSLGKFCFSVIISVFHFTFLFVFFILELKLFRYWLFGIDNFIFSSFLSSFPWLFILFSEIFPQLYLLTHVLNFSDYYPWKFHFISFFSFSSFLPFPFVKENSSVYYGS